MPKIVDHDKQKQIVAEAAIRVIRRTGLDRATVRNIAKEAGLSVGSLRHYFSTQDELFAFCMNIFRERTETRVESMELGEEVLPALKRLLLQFLPVDEDRKMEMEVWLSFSTKSLMRPELKRIGEDMYAGMRSASLFAVHKLVEAKLAKKDLDADLEAETLHALLDGLAIHQLLHPGTMPAERAELLLDRHLRSLCE